MSQIDRVVLVTGASRGLGLEIARLLARAGTKLVLTARGEAALRDVAHELSARTEVLALSGDVADAAHREALVAAALARFGRVDVLINNASALGPSPMPRLEDYPVDALDAAFRVNVTAPLALAQRLLPAMRARGAGLIVNVSSDAGANAYPGWGGYGTTKAALEHLSRVLARELEGSGVRLYVVDPGDMDTQMHREAEPGVDLAHLPRPEAVAPAFAWLIDHERAAAGRYEAPRILDALAAAAKSSGSAATPGAQA